MFADLIQQIKTQQPTYTLKQYVDVFDNYNSWRQSMIIAIRDQDITVSFDGWSNKYDETHKANSNRVACFRSHSEPYTGAQKYAIREFNFQKEIDHIQKVIAKLSELIVQEFQGMEASTYCQFVRGELFIIIDSVLQDPSQFSQGELRVATDLIEAFIRFFISWAIKSLDKIAVYIQGLQAHPLIYYYDLDTGIVASHSEMFDTLNKIFSTYQIRTKKFCQANETGLMKMYGITDRYAFVQQGFIKYFQDGNGLQAIENLLMWSHGDGDAKQKIPFLIIKNILPLIDSIQKGLSPQIRSEWLQKIKEIIFNRLHQLTTLDLKEGNMSLIFQILKQMPQNMGGIATISQDCECAEVKLAILLIKSSILEKKIKGVKELTDLIDKISKPLYSQVSVQYFNETKLAKFLQEEKVFEILLNEAAHAEVFKRSAPIMRFLAEQVNLHPKDIEQLWEASQNRHETEAKSIYEVISDLARVINNDQLEMILQRVSSIQQKDIDLYLITFIRDFTISSSRNPQKKLKYLPSLQVMWELLQDKSEVQNHLMGALMSGFVQCVRNEREQYQQLCLENLKKGVSFPQSLHILQKIIESYGQNSSSWNQSSSEDCLNRIMKENPLIDLIVKNLESYRASVQTCTDCTAILVGKIAHAQRIQYKIDFLEYIAASPKKFEFTLENFKKLWNILIVSPIHDTDRNPMLDFLIKGNFRVKEDLFKNVFCILNYPMKQCYKSIEKYFMQLNQKSGTINCQKQLLRILKYDQIIGLDFFFDVVFSLNEVDSAIQTLIQLHLRTEKVNQVDSKLQMWNALLNRCKEALRMPNCQVQNVIKCLKDLVTGIEGKQYLNGSGPANTQTKFYVQLGKDEKTQREVSLPSNCTLLFVRKHLNQLFNLKEQDYDLFLVNYDTKLNQETEEEYPINIVEESRQREKPDIIIQNLSQNQNHFFLSIRKFKTMLSSNTELSEILFDLLQSENYEDIWEVLTLMPQNKQIKQQLEKGAQDEEQWSRILYFNCNKKLLYCLQIYESMLDKRVIEQFMRNKGCQSLINYYMKRQDNEFSNLFNLKCFAQIAKILHICNVREQEINRRSVKYIIAALNGIENKVYSDCSSIQSFLTQNFKIASTENLSDFDQIVKGLIDLIDPQIRKTLCQQLIELKPLHKHFSNLGEKLQIVLKLKNQAEQYLELYAGVLQHNPNNDLTKITARLPQILMAFLNEEETEKILYQSFKLLNIVVAKCEESHLMIATNQELCEAIVSSLFRLDKRVLQSQETRKAGYELVLKLFSNEQLMITFESYFQCAFWRTNSPGNWNIVQTQQSKSRSGYVGLRNLGCICYMNSLMQQLFTLPNFRDCVLSLSLEQKQQSVLYQFQLLLSALKNSQKQFYDPRSFCNVLGPDFTPINYQEQMDVDEFFLQLMDKLEIELKTMSRDMIIRKSFGGFLSTEFISKGCQHQSSREELFLALSLQVKNKKNIYESLKMMTDGEMLEGDNAYQCEKCEKKVPALMRVCIKQLPNVLIMVLKRFEFNYETLQKFKLNDYYEFPTQLNMKPYTKEYLHKQDLQDKDDADRPLEDREYSEEYYDYHLRGVIIHVGTADSGHYYSLIKDAQTNQWNEFNDILIKPFEFSDLANEAFGSDDKTKNNNIMGRAKNAYMLFYERKTYFDENGKPLRNEQDLRWFFNNNKKEKENDEILQDNIKFQISQIMFDEGFFDFSCGLLKQGHELSIGRFCLQYFLTVVIRFQDRGIFVSRYFEQLKSITRSNIQLTSEFLYSLQNKDVLNELILQNPIQDMRVIVGGIIVDSIKCIIESEKYLNYNDFKQKSMLIQIIQSFLYYISNGTKNTDQIQKAFYQLSTSENCKTYMRELKCVGRILLYILEEPPVGAGYIEIHEPVVEQKLLKINKQFIFHEQQQIGQMVTSNISKFDNFHHDHTYLIMTLNQLIHLNDDELCMLEDPQLIKKLLNIAYTRLGKLALKDVLQKFVKLSVDPWQQSLTVVQIIYEFMRDCDEKDVKTALVALKGIAEIEDAYSESRVIIVDIQLILVAEAYILALKDNLSYWLYAGVVFDYILKISSALPILNAIRCVLLSNKSVLKLLQQWIKESSNPYQNFSQQRWKLYKKKVINVSPMDINDKLNKFQALSQKRLDTMEKIMNQQIYDSGYDSDQPMTQIGQLVDVIVPLRTYLNNFDNSGYQTWNVMINLGDMAELKSQQGNTKWVFTTDSSLAPPNTQTIKYENHVSFAK